MSSFEHRIPARKNVNIRWKGDWKAISDTDETAADYDDSGWVRLPKPISLEEAGLLEHGYVWYRGQFELPKKASGMQIVYPGNATDRQYVYVNGNLVFSGITPPNEPQKINIDDKFIRPGQNCLAVLYANTFHNKSHPHEGAILKYSGIMSPILITARTATDSYATDILSFKVREQLNGILKGHTKVSCDDSNWVDVPAAKKYSVDDEMGAIVWLRRKFMYSSRPGTTTAVKLIIPDARERCVFYLNGKPLGQFESVGPQHDFYIPETFLKKENVLSIILEGTDSYLVEPQLDTFYQAAETDIQLVFE
jgi:hypothetical protein